MKARKITKLLSSLSRQERKNFLDWLEFELGAENHKIYTFAEALRHNLNEQEIWTLAFPEKAFDDGEFRKLGTIVQDYCEKYLALKYFRKDPEPLDLYTLKALVHRTDVNLFTKSYRKVRARMMRQGAKDAQFYEFLWKQDAACLQFLFLNNEQALQAEMSEKLLASYELYLLHSWAETAVFAQSNAIGLSLASAAEPFMTAEFMEGLSRYPHFAQYPTLQFLQKLYFLNKNQAGEIAEIANDFYQIHTLFNAERAANLLTALVNPCFLKFNRYGDATWLHVASDLLEFGINKKYLLHRNLLHPHYYRALVLIWIHLGRPDIAMKKLDLFKPFLSEVYAEDHYQYFLAACAMAAEKYADAISIYQGHKFKDPLYKLDARVFMLFAYYGQNQIDLLPPLIEQRLGQFGQFDKLNQDIVANRRQLLEVLKQLTAAKTENALQEVEVKVKELEKKDWSRWLLLQVARMKASLAGDLAASHANASEMVRMLFGANNPSEDKSLT